MSEIERPNFSPACVVIARSLPRVRSLSSEQRL